MIKIEHNTETNEIKTIDLTPTEIAEIEANAQSVMDAENAKVTQKAALLEKLGITADEAALLLS